MRRALPYVVAILAILTVAYARSLRTVNSQAKLDAVARLERVPLQVGPWTGRAQTLDPRELTAGKIDGCLWRQYVHQDGTAVMLLIVCGSPGPISVHTPDICYAGAGYTPKQAALYTTPFAPSAQFWVSDFRYESPVPKPGLRIFWSWNAGQAPGWQAPENPRLVFAPRPFLYKAYIVRELREANPLPLEDDPAVKFLQAMLPVLDEALTPRTAGPTAGHRS